MKKSNDKKTLNVNKKKKYPIFKLPLIPPDQLQEKYDFWDNKNDLLVTDKNTGQILGIVEKDSLIKLAENLFLPIKKKEMKGWEKIIPKVTFLTNEQKGDLKSFIFKNSVENKSLTKRDIITFIEELGKYKKIQRYRQSGHLVDQKLKYKPSIIEFDRTKEKIKESKLEVKAEGIKLTAPEEKLNHALTSLLHSKSQNRNPKSEDFYSGNDEPKLVPYGGQDVKAPVVRFKKPELYKAYLNKDNYTGGEAEYIDNLLLQYANKKFFIKYDRIHKVENEKGEIINLTDRIEDFSPLIKLLYFYPALTDEQKKKIDEGDSTLRTQKEEIIILYSPIFIDQIDSKFIEYPEDINRRLMIAAGGWKKVTSSMNKLMDWCLREMSAKRFKIELNEETLIKVLNLEKLVKQNRKKRLEERIRKDIEAIKNMGIALKDERIQNSTNGFKWIFILNEDYN